MALTITNTINMPQLDDAQKPSPSGPEPRLKSRLLSFFTKTDATIASLTDDIPIDAAKSAPAAETLNPRPMDDVVYVMNVPHKTPQQPKGFAKFVSWISGHWASDSQKTLVPEAVSPSSSATPRVSVTSVDRSATRPDPATPDSIEVTQPAETGKDPADSSTPTPITRAELLRRLKYQIRRQNKGLSQIIETGANWTLYRCIDPRFVPDERVFSKSRVVRKLAGKSSVIVDGTAGADDGDNQHANQAQSRKTVAVKVLPRDRQAGETLAQHKKRVEREIKGQSVAGNVVVHVAPVVASWVGKKNGYIVMEDVCERTLKSVLEERGRLPWTEALDLFTKIVRTVQVLHRFRVMHRDISRKTLQFDAAGTPYLCDFHNGGFSIDYTHLISENLNSTDLEWAAPEIRDHLPSLFMPPMGFEEMAYRTDVFGCAMVFLHMFWGVSQMETWSKEYSHFFTPSHPAISKLPNFKLRPLIARMLATNPWDRPSMTEVLKHPFFESMCIKPTESA
ncbi:hypothetical protein HK102_003495 [Quaeritorhiza haematococci]|nr:hypothetical protein HK102_003495 [Quaeritorhiza haematococci]